MVAFMRPRNSAICFCGWTSSQVCFKLRSFVILRPAAAEQMTIAVARRPLRASEMTLERAARAIRLEGGIDLKDDTGDLAPIRIVGLGIEKTHIGDGVSLVVWRELGLAGRQICNIGIERRHGMNS
jgi:hypothetical protein